MPETDILCDSRIFPKLPKMGFFKVFRKFWSWFFFFFFLYIWYIMKVFIICYIHILIPCLEKDFSWDMGQNGLMQSDCRIFESTVSLVQNNELVWLFLYINTNSWWFMAILKIFGWALSKLCDPSDHGTLKLAYLKKELI